MSVVLSVLTVWVILAAAVTLLVGRVAADRETHQS